MTVKTGVVEFFNPNGKKTARGGTLYSFKMDDEQWYSCGFDSPPETMEAGDTVKFDYVANAKGYEQVDLASLKIKKNKSATKKSPAAKAAGGKENYDARAKYWEDKEGRDINLQQRIGYAGALNSALSLSGSLLAAGVFPVSAALLKKKEGLDATQEVIYKLADEFYVRINTRPFELDADGAGLTEEEVNGASELEATEKEEEEEKDDEGWDD